MRHHVADLGDCVPAPEAGPANAVAVANLDEIWVEGPVRVHHHVVPRGPGRRAQEQEKGRQGHFDPTNIASHHAYGCHRPYHSRRLQPTEESGTGSFAEPVLLPPPWIQTITGNGLDRAGSGGHALRYRPSSFSPRGVMIDEVCAQAGPKAFASRTRCQGIAGVRGRKRREPTGGAADGMPNERRAPPSSVPCTSP